MSIYFDDIVLTIGRNGKVGLITTSPYVRFLSSGQGIFTAPISLVGIRI